MLTTSICNYLIGYFDICKYYGYRPEEIRGLDYQAIRKSPYRRGDRHIYRMHALPNAQVGGR